jgi:hypothetical protein
MPDPLAPLWETILHAPDVARPDVVDVLGQAFPCARARLITILTWFGHSEGDCPVCWMMVGKLVYSVPEPIRGLGELLGGEPAPPVLTGAGLFLSSHLHPRHALPAGVSRERLAGIQGQARALPPEDAAALVDHWQALGRSAEALERALGRQG